MSNRGARPLGGARHSRSGGDVRVLGTGARLVMVRLSRVPFVRKGVIRVIDPVVLALCRGAMEAAPSGRRSKGSKFVLEITSGALGFLALGECVSEPSFPDSGVFDIDGGREQMRLVGSKVQSRHDLFVGEVAAVATEVLKGRLDVLVGNRVKSVFNLLGVSIFVGDRVGITDGVEFFIGKYGCE